MTKQSKEPLTLLFEGLKDYCVNAYREYLGEVPKAILDTMDILFEGKMHKPLLIKKGITKNENGWHFIFKMNPGCSYADILSKQDYFNSVIAGRIEFKKIESFLHINVNTYKFAKQYKFNAKEIQDLILDTPAYQKMYLPIVIGIQDNGKLLVVDLTRIPHVLFAGLNNSGKSSWIVQLLYGIKLVRPETIIIYIDLKGTDAPLIEPIGVAIARDPVKTRECLKACCREVDKRVRKLIDLKMRKVQDNMSHVVVVIDELTELKDKESQEYLNELARMSRNTGFDLIIGTQYPSSKTYKDFCESRTQFEARFCCRLAEDKDSRVVLDNDKAHKLIPANTPGRAIWQWGESKVVHSLYIEDDEFDEILKYINLQKEEIKFYEQPDPWTLPR